MRMFVTMFVGCLAGIAGCGPETYTVSGHVRFTDGKPLVAGMVDVEQQNGNVGASVQLAADGSFTFPDLPPGEYAVSFSQAYLPGIRPDPATGEKGQPPSGVLVHERFLKPSTSGLKIAVPADGTVNLVVEK